MRIIFVAVMCAIFTVPTFAQEELGLEEKTWYLTLDTYWHGEFAYRTHSNDPIMKDMTADASFYRNEGFTIGVNELNIMSCELSTSYFYGTNAITYTVDYAVIYQEAFKKGGSGFRPYFGAGPSVEWTEKFTKLYSKYNVKARGSKYGLGIVAKAGLRYYNGLFLLGAGIDYHYYPLASYDRKNVHNKSFRSDKFKYHTFKFGFNIGIIF